MSIVNKKRLEIVKILKFAIIVIKERAPKGYFGRRHGIGEK